MKKRLLSALLALALVFVLLPTTALAKVVSDYFDCDISILGNYWKFEKDSNNEYLPVYYKSEASSFEDSTVAPENNYLEIRKTGEKEITITVHGDVNITATGIYIDTIAASKSVIINGDGHLTVKYTWTKSGQNYSAIDVSTLTVEGVALSAEASMGPALFATYGIHIKDGAMVEAKSGYFEAVCEGTTNKPGGITVDNATLVATATGGGNRSAIKTYGDIAFTNAKVTATNKSSENAAIQAKTYEGKLNYLYVSGTSTITATNQSTSTDTMARAIGATIKNNNTSEKIEVGSSKVDAGKTWYTNAKQVTITSPALEKDSYAYIAGDPAVVGVETSIPSANGSGTYFYDQASKTLTLNNVTINKTSNNAAKAIQFDKNNGTYTVNLVGTNTISNVSYGISTNSAYSEATSMSVTITGSGSLDISAKAYAIEVPKGDLTFNGAGEIKLTTSYKYPATTCNALYVAGNVTIDTTKYGITGQKQAQGFPTEDIGNSPVFETILKGTDSTLYFKSITIAPKPSETYYNGTAMKYGETRNAGSGTIFCDENGVITLNGATAGTLEFRSSADSTLVLKGTSTLSSIETTQKGLTISGSGSLTVGSIRVPNITRHTANLTITGGAHVTVNRPSSEDKPAVEVSGNLTVTGDGTQLSAECTAATNPAIEVGGNVTISGNPGTNAYTVKAHNKYATQRGRVEGLSPSQMPSAFEISGNLSISDSARVMAQTNSDGAAVWMPARKVISVVDASLIAQNSSHNFSTISFGDESDMGNIYAKGQVNIVAENMLHSNSSLAHKAIKAFIYNHYSTGDSNPYYIKVVSEGVQSGGNVNVIPGHCTSTGDYKVTITRGDEVTRTNSPVVIAGTTLLNDTYYTITDGSTVAEGTESNYNAFYDSDKKTLKLNNASINGAGTNKAIEANVGGYTFTIELVGNNIIKTSGFANNVIDITGNLYFTGSGTAEISGKGTPIYATYKIDVSADVTITNTEKAGSFTFSPYGENSSDNYKGANTFAIGAGYTAYATTDKTTWAVYDNTTASENESYTTLRITTQPLETGGGSTHQHTYDQSAWKSDATHHWRECTDPNCPDPTKGITNKAPHSFSNGTCTICGYRGQTEEHHFSTDWTYDETHHWHACTDDGCTAIKDKAPHEWTGWRIDEPSPGMHNRFCNCGYNDYSHHYNLVYAAAGEAGHYQYCTLGNCTFKTSTVPHNYDGDTCTICNYTKSGEIVPPTPDNPGTIVIIRPAEEEKPAQQPNPSTGANDLVGLAVAAAVAAALGSAALLRKHD